jgi:spore maturation protein CgeB
LIDALGGLGHKVVFFERSVPYHAADQDGADLHPAQLVVYSSWDEAQRAADDHLADADVAMVTSHCPDSLAACNHVLGSRVPIRVFYDLDAPQTIERASAGQPIPYLPSRGLQDFDLVLSASGGGMVEDLVAKAGARRAAVLYGCVDPRVFSPTPGSAEHGADLAYLGAYSRPHEDSFERLLLRPARSVASKRFIVAGSQYPDGFDWPANVRHVNHVYPDQKAAFYCSSPMTLSLAPPSMARTGHCPPVRIFEASACGVPVVTDEWIGIEQFYEPGKEILVVHTTQDMLVTLSRSPASFARIGKAARDRTLAQHTGGHRAAELVEILSSMPSSRIGPKVPTTHNASTEAQRHVAEFQWAEGV